jgi:hypothetical protein
MRSQVEYHNLSKTLAKVSQKYLGRLVDDVKIEWMKYNLPRNGKCRRHMAWGMYFHETKTIKIHGVLNQSWVPKFFVELVVYHELLHHVMIPTLSQRAMRAGKVEWHPELFMVAERQFKHYEKALQWEQKHMNRLFRTKVRR